MTEQLPPLDPNVRMPAAVRAAAARSEEIYNQFKDQPLDPVTTAGNPLAAQPDPAPAAQPDPATVAQPVAQPAAQPAAQTDGVRPADNPPAAQNGPAAADAGTPDWENMYKAANGRYKQATVTIREQAEKIADMGRIIATLQSAPVSVPAEIELSEEVFTAEELGDYGEDFMKVVGKKARNELLPLIKQVLQDNAEMRRRVDGVSSVVQQDSRTKLQTTLDQNLPNWREINQDQGFLAWLGLPDPFSGVIRHDMLKAAYSQGDAPRVMAFFKGFLAEEAAVTPGRVETPQVDQVVNKVPLETFAAPGRAKTTAANPAPVEKPIFTRAQIAGFYADVSAGKYRGRDADKNQIEVMIFDAQREGRIR